MTGFALPHGTAHHFTDIGIKVSAVNPFGAAGLVWKLHRDEGDRGSMIVTQAEYPDGSEWLHASLAWADRDPTYRELAAMKAVVFGRRRPAYMVLPPESEHVNIHEHALHLYGRADGVPQLPDFTMGGRSI